MIRAVAIGLVAGALVLAAPAAHAQPFGGTIFISPNIVTASDPTTFTGTTYTGQGVRTVFDRRVNGIVTINAYLFNTTTAGGPSVEMIVNPEFGSVAAAATQANRYGTEIGRLPAVLRSNVRAVIVHQGVEPFGGSDGGAAGGSVLIHTGQADLYVASGILEETLIHEAAHASLDRDHANSAGCGAAQLADPNFISTYARDNPTREDIAESFLPYIAIRYRPDRISPALVNTITATIPNRIAYFDAQNFNMHPYVSVPEPSSLALAGVALTGAIGGWWRRRRRR